MREVDYKFEVLRNGVVIKHLSALGSPALKHQSSGTIMRSLTVQIEPVDGVNWYMDRIKPSMYLDGQWYPLGVFVVSSAPEDYRNGRSIINIQAMDQTLLVQQMSTEGTLHLTAGTGYLSAITALLIASGIPNAIADTNTDVLATDREDWDEGTKCIEIVNQLLGEIGYNPLWFDSSGMARLTKYVAPNIANITHIYKGDEASLIADACKVVVDCYDPHNVFKAIVSNSDMAEPMVAVSVNADPLSPISTAQLGRRIMAPVVKLDNIASQEALQAYTDKMRGESLLTDEVITFTTANVPTHGYLDTVAIEHERIRGVYRETDWSMTLAYNGQMVHTAKRILTI